MPLPFRELRLDHSGIAPTYIMMESLPRREDKRKHSTVWGTMCNMRLALKGFVRESRKRVNTSGRKAWPQRAQDQESKTGRTWWLVLSQPGSSVLRVW